jgi:dUTP pyrophosphatase
VLDSGYVGEIGVLLANLTGADYTITQGDKIAQLVIREHISMPIEEVTELPDSDRGSKGFGSSGK